MHFVPRFFHAGHVDTHEFDVLDPPSGLSPTAATSYPRTCHILGAPASVLAGWYTGPAYANVSDGFECGGTPLTHLLPDTSTAPFLAPGDDFDHCKALCYNSSRAFNTSIPVASSCRGFNYHYTYRQCWWQTGRFNQDSLTVKTNHVCYAAPVGETYQYSGQAVFTAHVDKRCVIDPLPAPAMLQYLTPLSHLGPPAQSSGTASTLIAMDGLAECQQLCYEYSSFAVVPPESLHRCAGFEWDADKRSCKFIRGWAVAANMQEDHSKVCYALGPAASAAAYAASAENPTAVFTNSSSGIECDGENVEANPLLPVDSGTNVYVTPGGDVEECKSLCYAASFYNASITAVEEVDACWGFSYNAMHHECRWRTKQPGQGPLGPSAKGAAASSFCFALAVPPVEYVGVEYVVVSNHECEGGALSSLTPIAEHDTMAPYQPAGTVSECMDLCYRASFWIVDTNIAEACRGFTFSPDGKCSWFKAQGYPEPGHATHILHSESGASCYYLPNANVSYTGTGVFEKISGTACSLSTSNVLHVLAEPMAGPRARRQLDESSGRPKRAEEVPFFAASQLYPDLLGPPVAITSVKRQTHRPHLLSEKNLPAPIFQRQLSETSTTTPASTTIATRYRVVGRDLDACRQLCYESSAFIHDLSANEACMGFTFNETDHKCYWHVGDVTASGANSLPSDSNKDCYLISAAPFSYTGSQYPDFAEYDTHVDKKCVHESGGSNATTPVVGGAAECKQICYENSDFFWGVPEASTDVELLCRGFDYAAFEGCRFFTSGEVKSGQFDPAPAASRPSEVGYNCSILAEQHSVYSGPNYTVSANSQCGGTALPNLFTNPGDHGINYTSPFVAIAGDVEECQILCESASASNASIPIASVCRGFDYDSQLRQCRWLSGRFNVDSLVRGVDFLPRPILSILPHIVTNEDHGTITSCNKLMLGILVLPMLMCSVWIKGDSGTQKPTPQRLQNSTHIATARPWSQLFMPERRRGRCLQIKTVAERHKISG